MLSLLLFLLFLLTSTTSIVFSSMYNSCSNELNLMYLNKTQKYIENQSSLFRTTWHIIEKNTAEIESDEKQETESRESIIHSLGNYDFFVGNMQKYDGQIASKLNDCNHKSNVTNYLLLLTILFAIIHVLFSLRYLNRSF